MNFNRRDIMRAPTVALAYTSLPMLGGSLLACSDTPTPPQPEDDSSSSTIPEIYEAFSESFWSLIVKSANVETLGTGYGWSEGPVWDRERNRLYFTDVPGNVAYSWSEAEGVKPFLSPSGASVTEGFREPGANGLWIARNRKLLVCNHGKRAVEMIDIDTKARTTLTDNYNGLPYNSPNDIVESPSGDLYFTDPPYGLDGLDASPLKQQPHNGVYHRAPSGEIRLLIADMTRPNGIALSPDGSTLYIAQSDPDAQHIYTLNLLADRPRKTLFVDLGAHTGPSYPGLPDGMCIDHKGHIFATGPGGVFIITPSGNVLGRIKTGKASANCTFGEDGRTLFITNHDSLIKLRTRTRGLAWS